MSECTDAGWLAGPASAWKRPSRIRSRESRQSEMAPSERPHAASRIQLERSTGNWIHETLSELRSKGKYTHEVLLDEVPIPGSPVEWIVKPKAVTQERADKKDDKTPTT